MTKVARRLFVDGDYFEVACAVASDGVTSPAARTIDELEVGMWDDPHADSLPDEYQPKLRSQLLAHLTNLANYGDLPPSAYNRLRDGIWEVKVESIRITFFDTDGQGGWTPKLGTRVDKWDGYRWDLPADFDEYLRLGHSFAKTGQKTPSDHIDASLHMREEDTAHDR